MHLKRLELSGFKSFAKTTVLEFPSRITAIVGPNGSGKSNITEGIRWVLGEQSMKSLRGKKGEDLIWNGSPQVPRTGKAAVTLLFDNADGKIAIEFDEVALSRKIFRDGLNEYYINDAQVRLKDVVELMARIGLGETKHNIISQGEVDRLLLSSARERREMLEEALGLRVYQIKKRETERKLEQTEANMKQVEALLREITPHLKFLKLQAEKSRARGATEEELRRLELTYFFKEEQEIKIEKKQSLARSAPLYARQESIKKEIGELAMRKSEEEKNMIRADIDRGAETKISLLLEKRRELERELGRLEGKLEASATLSVPHTEVLPASQNGDTVREFMNTVRAFLRDARALLYEEDRMSVVRSHLGVLMGDLERTLTGFERGEMPRAAPQNAKKSGTEELERMIASARNNSDAIGAELEKMQQAQKESRERFGKIRGALRAIDDALRVTQDEEREVALGLERFRFEEEQMSIREKTFAEELSRARLTLEDLKGRILEGYGEYSRIELKRKIERVRIKLEEAGGIDPSVIREYEETETRRNFLGKELDDLKEANGALHELIKELEHHIKEDFHNGFAKIKEEFHNYFRVIFGGGRAVLELIAEKKDEGDEEDAHVPKEEGIDISVDLPRKRIQGLAMLSGGERALTAIALLFAITAVNPPPFLILDETDAALDEANSQRYGAILKELAKKTQLLLVTHNRETMKCAGILYGVTMGEDGVSKFLSLKLEEAEAYTNR